MLTCPSFVFRLPLTSSTHADISVTVQLRASWQRLSLYLSNPRFLSSTLERSSSCSVVSSIFARGTPKRGSLQIARKRFQWSSLRPGKRVDISLEIIPIARSSKLSGPLGRTNVPRFISQERVASVLPWMSLHAWKGAVPIETRAKNLGVSCFPRGCSRKEPNRDR